MQAAATITINNQNAAGVGFNDAPPGAGCETFRPANRTAVRSRVALISRGVCGFAIKVKNALNAGPIAMLICDNVAETAVVPSGLGSADPTITIPAVRIFLSDAQKLATALQSRSRSSSGGFVSLGPVLDQYAGADPQGRAQMFAPNPFQSGSSVSHFDTTMTRNQLMEPAINGDLPQSVIPPIDMTFALLQDSGWQGSEPGRRPKARRKPRPFSWSA